jgi:hypothetical protein
MQKFHQQFDLPPVPAHLWPKTDNAKLLFSNKSEVVKRNGGTLQSDHYNRYEIDSDLETWVKQNITDNYCNIGLAKMSDGPVNLPHTDTTREYTLLYLFETGGPAVETKFWRFSSGAITNCLDFRPADCDQLELLDSIILDPHQWYLLDARTIHSVENKVSDRVSLQLGFMADSAWIQRYSTL